MSSDTFSDDAAVLFQRIRGAACTKANTDIAGLMDPVYALEKRIVEGTYDGKLLGLNREAQNRLERVRESMRTAQDAIRAVYEYKMREAAASHLATAVTAAINAA
jgi:hypothetical protein